MNEVIKQLLNRKSVRIFENKIVEEEKKDLIFQAAINGPTAGNMTLYSIIDVQDQKIKDKLAITCDNQPFIASAPMVLIFVADYQKWYDAFKLCDLNARKPSYGDFLLAYSDALIACQSAVVAADSLGLGSCYIGDIIERFEDHQELLNLPKYCIPVAMVVIGYPTSQQIKRVSPPRFNKEDIVCVDRYTKFDDTRIKEMFDSKAKKSNGEGMDNISRVYRRKWCNPFIEEMSRSAKLWIDNWTSDEG